MASLQLAEAFCRRMLKCINWLLSDPCSSQKQFHCPIGHELGNGLVEVSDYFTTSLVQAHAGLDKSHEAP